jgi:PAS domain-containing protein
VSLNERRANHFAFVQFSYFQSTNSRRVDMAMLSRTVQRKSSRMSKKQGRKITASAEGTARDSIRTNMKKTKLAPGMSRKFSANGAERKDGATKQSASAPVFKHPHPKTELEATSQRHFDSEERYRTLFNLSPMAVYSIDASGVIRDFNRHAVELWGREPALGDTDQRSAPKSTKKHVSGNRRISGDLL